MNFYFALPAEPEAWGSTRNNILTKQSTLCVTVGCLGEHRTQVVITYTCCFFSLSLMMKRIWLSCLFDVFEFVRGASSDFTIWKATLQVASTSMQLVCATAARHHKFIRKLTSAYLHSIFWTRSNLRIARKLLHKKSLPVKKWRKNHKQILKCYCTYVPNTPQHHHRQPALPPTHPSHLVPRRRPCSLLSLRIQQVRRRCPSHP